jgi:acyl-CoA reductase-like NAD-dependent aldehyde dehydrogenase
MKISRLIKDKNLSKSIFPYGIDQFASINPTNNKLIKMYEYETPENLQEKLHLSQLSFTDWRDKGLDYRLEKMKIMADKMIQSKEDLAETITREMVKIRLILG